MQKTLPLTDLYEKYSQGKLNRKELEGAIYTYILNNTSRFSLYHWDRDECMDYLSWLYPRIHSAVERYRNTGASFDSFIHSLVKWSSREYHSRKTEHRIVEMSCWESRAQESVSSEEEPPYHEECHIPKRINNPRQTLLLLLKCYYFVSEDFLQRIAPSVGMEKEILSLLVERLRQLRYERELERRKLQERIYSQYYRCLSFERRMLAAADGSARREKMEGALIKARKRLISMRKRFLSMRTEASNREVAELLGIPKGTVDSNLYALKWKWKVYKE